MNADVCTGGTKNCGGAQIWLGYDSTKGELFSGTYDFYLKGVNDSDNAGNTVASCDVNNDTISDVILSGPGIENGTGYTGSCSGADCGGVIVYFGINSGGAFNSTPDMELYGMNASDTLALKENQAPVACGDVNNDSIADIVWGRLVRMIMPLHCKTKALQLFILESHRGRHGIQPLTWNCLEGMTQTLPDFLLALAMLIMTELKIYLWARLMQMRQE